MKGRVSVLTLLGVSLVTSAGGALAAGCTLAKLTELPVTMTGLRPVVSAKINGTDATFIADSGAFYSLITPNAAAQLGLRVQPLSYELTLYGTGGSSRAMYTAVKRFTLANISLSNAEFAVGGSDVGAGTVGLIGQNILRAGDVEYDLANGTIKLWRPKDCGKSELAYWAGDKPYSVIDIEWASFASPHTKGVAYVNGAKITVMFDTGAAQSVLKLRAAERAGITPDSNGVVQAGYSHGLGRRGVQTWVAPFSSFKIGDEEVRNTRLRFGDISLDTADMLIGADFFLSHRVYVASSQRKLYFTYNGGPVFNLNAVPLSVQHADEPGTATAGTNTPQGPGASGDTTAGGGGAPSADGTPAAATPTDAADFSRRGTAFAARHDYEHAIADLTRACELGPNEPQYFYQRGMARLGNRQPFQAMTDFDQALKLKPDDVPSLIARSELRLEGRDVSSAAADLDAADRAVPKDADVRLGLAGLYARSGRFESAITQYDLWLPAHYEDSRRIEAFIGRCRARALLGQDLPKALSDCNDAVRLNPKAPRALDSRGLVRLRMGDFDKSIADYDAALTVAPRFAWSLYGRGLDEVRKGMSSKGQADMAAATALQPAIANEARHFGLNP
jgi:tetratricopeptide (TPR) repeat protein